MKKLMIILLLLLSGFSFAQETRSAVRFEYLTGTEVAYSDTFETAGVMGLDYWADDTSATGAGDSTGVQIEYQSTATPNDSTYGSWTTQFTITLTDSGSGKYKITEYAIDNDPYGRYKYTGLSTNKKVSATKVRTTHKNTWTERRP